MSVLASELRPVDVTVGTAALGADKAGTRSEIGAMGSTGHQFLYIEHIRLERSNGAIESLGGAMVEKIVRVLESIVVVIRPNDAEVGLAFVVQTGPTVLEDSRASHRAAIACL